ncbi:ADP-specific phosphofructokinase [Candidatus Norongarragalina meridionalis]|nr:ADP-specific phosphofructokinase [Candidatus Norongarragalina meridionalis]
MHLKAPRVATGVTPRSPPTLNNEQDFWDALAQCMSLGKSMHVTGSPEIIDWFSKAMKPDEKRAGGQAAIMANQLTALGGDAVFSPAILSPLQAQRINEKVRVPVAEKGKLRFTTPSEAARPQDVTKINWVFEFRTGEKLRHKNGEIAAPRSNRLIVASVVLKEMPLFREELEPHLPEIGESVSCALLAGYHYISDPEVAKKCVPQLAALRRRKKILLHFEYVPFEHKSAEAPVLREITKEAKSFGANEAETVEVLRALGFGQIAERLKARENAFVLYDAAKHVFEHLGLERFHVHNLGYNLVLLDKSANPEKARDGCVFAALAASAKASSGKSFVSPPDISALVLSKGLMDAHAFAAEVADLYHADEKALLSDGIADMGKHYLVFVPTPVVEAKTTVGLGDVVSSVALAKEMI